MPDDDLIPVGRRIFRVSEFVGEVTSVDRFRKLTYWVGGGATAATSIYDRVHLIGDAGTAECIEFNAADLSVKSGHKLQVIWLTEIGNDSPLCIAVRDLSTGDHSWIFDGMREATRPFASLPFWIMASFKFLWIVFAGVLVLSGRGLTLFMACAPPYLLYRLIAWKISGRREVAIKKALADYIEP